MDIDPAAATPRTSTRDRTVLRAQLDAWLAPQIPGARITDFSAPTANGMSSETLLFTAVWRDGVEDTTHRCVARLPPAADAVPVFPVYDLEKQSRVMQIARARACTQVTLCMAGGGGASAAARAEAIFRPGALRWSGTGAAADGQGGHHARRESASVERTAWWWGGASGSSCCLAQLAPPSRSRRLMPRRRCASLGRNGEAWFGVKGLPTPPMAA